MIRKADITDLDFIYQLSNQEMGSKFDYQMIKDYINAKETFSVFIVEKNDRIGFIILWESGENGQIFDFGIIDEFRRKGYGKLLLNFAINYFKKNNVKIISLEVREDNLAAIKLYESHGFIKQRVISKYYKDCDAFFYLRRL